MGFHKLCCCSASNVIVITSPKIQSLAPPGDAEQLKQVHLSSDINKNCCNISMCIANSFSSFT